MHVSQISYHGKKNLKKGKKQTTTTIKKSISKVKRLRKTDRWDVGGKAGRNG